MLMRRAMFVRLLAVSLFCAPAAWSKAETYAVLVGINDYPGDHMDLRGCVPDAQYFRDFLTAHADLKEHNTRMLLDGNASESELLRALLWLASVSRPGDRAVFVYSGHGSKKETSALEERDGENELICLADSTYLEDDLLSGVAKQMAARGVHVTMVFDSCFSGGMSRDKDRPKFVEFKDLKGFRSVRKGIEEVINSSAEVLGQATEGGSYAILSSSQENETSADASLSDGTYHGAFVWALSTLLVEDPTISIRTMYSRIGELLARYGFKQNPRAETSSKTRLDAPIID